MPVSHLYYHVECHTDRQLCNAIERTDDSSTTGNWTYDASTEVNQLYTDAMLRSTRHSADPPDMNSNPGVLNLTIRQQRRFNKGNYARKRTWDSTVNKWQQEVEKKWLSKNAREVSSLKNKVST